MIPDEHKGKKFAVYLRRSQGETGDTKAQLARIDKKLNKLEKSKTIKKLNRKVVGRDINGKIKFNADRDLIVSGDIFNEGNGQSGFKFEERPVLIELIKRMREGEYDGIIVESMDRFARDFAGLSHLALPLWREEGKVIYALESGQTLDANRTNEAIINSQMTWGGIGKQTEISKSKQALRGKIAQGYLSGSRVQFLGDKSKAGNTGVDYRKLWNVSKASGENANGNPNNGTQIGRMFGRDNKFVNLWYGKMKNFDELGVLDNWLKAVEAMNTFVRENGGEYPRRFFTTNKAKRLFDRTRGYFGYPAGVNLAGTNTFVRFSYPLDFDLEELATSKNVPDGYVVEEEITAEQKSNLNVAQTQPRARGKL